MEKRSWSAISAGLVCFAVYLVGGIALSILHTNLANGEPIHGVFAAVLMPVVVAAVHISFEMWKRDWWECHLQGSWKWGGLCAFLIVYTLLPVLFNVGSEMAYDFGYSEIGQAMFEYRYMSLAVIFLGLLFIDSVATAFVAQEE